MGFVKKSASAPLKPKLLAEQFRPSINERIMIVDISVPIKRIAEAGSVKTPAHVRLEKADSDGVLFITDWFEDQTRQSF